jgi:FkbM family methyltransferase
MLLFNAPLHSIRKRKFFQSLLKSRWNRPKLYNLGFSHRVALRPLTHGSIRWKKQHLEPSIRVLITSLVQKLDEHKDEGWFFDVGANVGLYVWEVAKVCPTRNILAFEPDPANFELLKMTQKEADLQNFALCPDALSNQTDEVSFSQDPLTSATGCIQGEEKPWIEQYLNGSTNQITINTRTMDSEVDNNKIPSLIKIDVEGHEVEVLEGAVNTLSKKKPLLIIESFPPKQEKVISHLQAYGYNLKDADRSSPVNSKTNNLFAWHPQGPLKESIIQKVLHK